MEKKIGSIKKLNHNNFIIKVGTFDKKNPTAIYFEGGTYITPIEKLDNYNEVLRKIYKDMDVFLRATMGKQMMHKYNFTTDVAIERIKPLKDTFYTFQIHLKPLNCDGKKFSDIVGEMNDGISKFLDEYTSSLEMEGFQCKKSKAKEDIYLQ